MKRFKQIMSILLSAIVCLSLSSITAYAENEKCINGEHSFSLADIEEPGVWNEDHTSFKHNYVCDFCGIKEMREMYITSFEEEGTCSREEGITFKAYQYYRCDENEEEYYWGYSYTDFVPTGEKSPDNHSIGYKYGEKECWSDDYQTYTWTEVCRECSKELQKYTLDTQSTRYEANCSYGSGTKYTCYIRYPDDFGWIGTDFIMIPDEGSTPDPTKHGWEFKNYWNDASDVWNNDYTCVSTVVKCEYCSKEETVESTDVSTIDYKADCAEPASKEYQAVIYKDGILIGSRKRKVYIGENDPTNHPDEWMWKTFEEWSESSEPLPEYIYSETCFKCGVSNDNIKADVIELEGTRINCQGTWKTFAAYEPGGLESGKYSISTKQYLIKGEGAAGEHVYRTSNGRWTENNNSCTVTVTCQYGDIEPYDVTCDQPIIYLSEDDNDCEHRVAYATFPDGETYEVSSVDISVPKEKHKHKFHYSVLDDVSQGGWEEFVQKGSIKGIVHCDCTYSTEKEITFEKEEIPANCYEGASVIYKAFTDSSREPVCSKTFYLTDDKDMSNHKYFEQFRFGKYSNVRGNNVEPLPTTCTFTRACICGGGEEKGVVDCQISLFEVASGDDSFSKYAIIADAYLAGKKYSSCLYRAFPKKDNTSLPIEQFTNLEPLVTEAECNADIAQQEDVMLTCQIPDSQFLNLSVNGETVPKDDYEVRSGSTIIVLHADYINRLIGEGKEKDALFVEMEFEDVEHSDNVMVESNINIVDNSTPEECNHQWDTETIIKKATCKEKGMKELTCSKCQETKQESISKNTNYHVGGTIVKNALEATCGADGYTGDTYCKGCDGKVTRGTVVPATGKHTEKIIPAVEPSATADGKTQSIVCSVCDKVIKEAEVISATGSRFSDVKGDEWYASSIEALADEGIVSGYEDGSFGVDDSITREQFALILYNAMGDGSVGTPLYSDEAYISSWAKSAVAWAQKNGYLVGSNNKYDPQGEVTMEMIASVLWRISGKPASDQDLSTYPDAASVSDWALDGVKWAVANNHVGNGSTLDPKNACSRSRFARIYAHYLGFVD